MKYLLMGYGSIGRTLMSIIESLGESYDITICDPEYNGITGQEMLQNCHDKFDAVINLTPEKTQPITELCDRFGLSYMDAGFEFDDGNDAKPDIYFNAVKKVITSPIKGKHLFGFGMNPGIIEWIVKKNAPEHPYHAIMFETDTAVPVLKEQQDILFGTWCPTTYYSESAESPGFIVGKEGRFIHIPRKKQRDLRFTTKTGTYNYDIIPHEELYSIVNFNDMCQGSAFIYHLPDAIMRFAHESSPSDENPWKRISNVPVLDNIAGEDQVGILFYDGSDNIRYCANRGNHQECFRKTGHNATCWQTACGVYIGLNLLPLLKPETNMTFSQACDTFGEQIEEMLEKLDFRIEKTDYFMDPVLFETQILPLFEG